MSPTEDQVRVLYDDMARWWRWTAVPDTILGLNRMRRLHFAGAEGSVLDVGCGTGENFAHLTSAESITAVDISPVMVEKAAARAGRAGAPIRVLEADAARLPFPAASFDTVVTAFSSCTFPDHVAAYEEMTRVARPGGTILLLEHGRSSQSWIARRQVRKAAAQLERTACRIDRDPVAELGDAGLTPTEHRRSHLGMIHRIRLTV